MKSEPIAYHGQPVKDIAALKRDHVRLLLGEKLARLVERRAADQKADVADHLREIVAEYFYLESLGA